MFLVVVVFVELHPIVTNVFPIVVVVVEVVVVVVVVVGVGVGVGVVVAAAVAVAVAVAAVAVAVARVVMIESGAWLPADHAIASQRTS